MGLVQKGELIRFVLVCLRTNFTRRFGFSSTATVTTNDTATAATGTCKHLEGTNLISCHKWNGARGMDKAVTIAIEVEVGRGIEWTIDSEN